MPSITALSGTAASCLVWRHRGRLHVTVIAKATFALVDGHVMTPAAPQPICAAEVHHGGLPNRSIRQAVDLAPRCDAVDVVLTGHAYAPGGHAAGAMVRLAILDGDRPLLDKRLRVVDPAGFTKVPLVYERALGGIGRADNPLGSDEPNIVDPVSPASPAGFGPISRGWQARRKLLGATPRKVVDAPVAELPDDFDFAYFQSAPEDQRVDRLRGDERIVLEGVHRERPAIHTRLPAVRGAARLDGLAEAGIADGTRIELRIESLHIDADDQRCSVVLRGSFEVPNEAMALAARVVVSVEPASSEDAFARAPAASPWQPAADAPEGPAVPLRSGPSSTVTMGPAERTIELEDADLEATETSIELEDDVTVEKSQRRPGPPARVATPPDPPAPAAPPPAPPAPAAPSIADEETAGPDDLLLAAGAAPLPFEPDAEPALPEASGPPAPRAPSDTLYLQPEEQASAARRLVVPFITTGRAEPSGGDEKGRAREPEPFVPPRTSDAIPVVTSAPLVAWTLPWQVLAGRDVRTLIVKGTFDIVPGGPARPRAEAALPSGDEHEDGDPSKDLRYPSDFAIFKPRADVTLRGHAHAPGGSAAVMEAGLRFGRDEKGFERRIAVIGERHWRRGVATDAAPFDRIPLVYGRAYGGSGFEGNPLGRGRVAGPDGRIALPNLEDRDNLTRSPSSAPGPVCFAPVPPFFRARTSKLGTFGPEWVKTRWPYFPDDFDWAYFQAAPEQQQVDFLTGDEPFSMWGVRPDAPRVTGKLPGLVPRAFAQRTTAEGGLFFEIVLRLDTVVIDADEMTMGLVWRGLFDVADAAASDVAEIYLLSARATEPRLDLRAARARHRAERGPWVVVPEEPDTGRAANIEPPRRGSVRPDPSATVVARLRAAGLATPSGPEGSPAVATPSRAPVPVPRAAAAPAPVPARSARDAAALRAEVEAHLARGAPLDELDLAGADLAGIDFRGGALAFVVLKGACLADCKLGGVDLSGAVLAGADLTGAILERANLTGADLTGAELGRASFDEADLTAADLGGARAEDATFRRARGDAPRFVEAALARARFDGAALPGADFTRATLDGAVLDDLRAPELRLHDARASAASFDRADLAGARADGAVLTRCSFVDVSAAASAWDGASLDRSSFLGASLAGAGFTRASCTGAVFSGATLTGAQLDHAILKRAAFAGANLMGASLQGADLTGVDLGGANLHAAETWQAKLTGARLDRAITTGTKLAQRKR